MAIGSRRGRLSLPAGNSADVEMKNVTVFSSRSPLLSPSEFQIFAPKPQTSGEFLLCLQQTHKKEPFVASVRTYIHSPVIKTRGGVGGAALHLCLRALKAPNVASLSGLSPALSCAVNTRYDTGHPSIHKREKKKKTSAVAPARIHKHGGIRRTN